jgi:hypothetical protein
LDWRRTPHPGCFFVGVANKGLKLNAASRASTFVDMRFEVLGAILGVESSRRQFSVPYAVLSEDAVSGVDGIEAESLAREGHFAIPYDDSHGEVRGGSGEANDQSINSQSCAKRKVA